MSKDITIKQDGVATDISVDKLRTAKEEGGSVAWVPEEDIGVKALRVWRNGTYTAEDMGVYGFDEVRVSVDNRGGKGAEPEGAIKTMEPVQENISIMVGDKPRKLSNVKHLIVDRQDEGTVLFTANSGLPTTSLYADQNRVAYRTTDNSVYDSVTVNIPDSEIDEDYSDLPLPDRIDEELNGPKTFWPTSHLYSTDIIVTASYYSNNVRSIWNERYYPNGIIPSGEYTLEPKYVKDCPIYLPRIRIKDCETIEEADAKYHGNPVYFIHEIEYNQVRKERFDLTSGITSWFWGSDDVMSIFDERYYPNYNIPCNSFDPRDKSQSYYAYLTPEEKNVALFIIADQNGVERWITVSVYSNNCTFMYTRENYVSTLVDYRFGRLKLYVVSETEQSITYNVHYMSSQNEPHTYIDEMNKLQFKGHTIYWSSISIWTDYDHNGEIRYSSVPVNRVIDAYESHSIGMDFFASVLVWNMLYGKRCCSVLWERPVDGQLLSVNWPFNMQRS